MINPDNNVVLNNDMVPDELGAYGRTPLPKGWRWARLGEVCQLNPSRPPRLIRPSDKPTTFVPMQAVNAEKGAISQVEIRPYTEVCRGFTYFAEGDVLFAKITPCMQNGKHAIATDLIDGIGFGSTEFHVIRPSSEILSDWIHKFLRQPYILRSAMAHFSGAVGQQRVPIGFIANLQLPLPPLPEQQRIAAILNEKMAHIEKARQATERQLEAARALPAAYLRSVFNSPEAQEWPKKTLGDLCKFKRGPFGGSLKKELFVKIGYKVYEQKNAK